MSFPLTLEIMQICEKETADIKISKNIPLHQEACSNL